MDPLQTKQGLENCEIVVNLWREKDWAMELKERIGQVIQDRESAELEFKSAKGGFPRSFWESYSALANTDGGTIVLGVAEKEGRFVPDGLSEEQIEQYKKHFWTNVNNRNTVSVNLMSNRDVVECEHEGARFLLFYVPRADREQRPVYLTPQPYRNTFKRYDEGDFVCDDGEVRRMFADADKSRPADSRILEGYSWSDIDRDSFNQFRLLFGVAKPDHPWLASNDQELMRLLGGYRKDHRTGREGFTLAGLLMFGKTESITDPECCPYYMVDYREIPQDDSKIRWIDRVYPDGTWEANLFQFYRRVLPKLQNAIPRPFRMEGNTRMDNSPAHDALREALVNFIVHAYYSTEAALVITRWPDRIVFSNPGTLLISRGQFYLGGESECRNPSLQRMFMMLGDAEKAGGGTSKIINGWKWLGLEAPYIKEKHKPDKVELYVILKTSDISEKNMERNEEKVERTGKNMERNEEKVERTDENMERTGENMERNEEKVERTDENMERTEKKVERKKGTALQQEIIAFCSDWKLTSEIADYVKRDGKYLLNFVLPKMVAEEKLELKYPESKKHRNQMYRKKNQQLNI